MSVIDAPHFERTEHGFRNGAIDVSSGFSHERGSGIRITVGSVTVWVQATTAGRHVWVEVTDGTPDRSDYQRHALEFGGKSKEADHE
jgi:hypothetical protein